MRTSSSRPFVISVLCAILALAGCATPAGGAVGGAPAPVEVVGTGTVIESDGAARLCFIVAESYPPQCGDGVALGGWTWDGVAGAERASGVTWGSYAVRGSFDGETLTVSEPPQSLALYDPAPFTPSGDPAQRELDDRFGEGALRLVE